KNRGPRIFPFRYHPRLESLLTEKRALVSQWELRHGQLCPSMFHWKGRPVSDIRSSWKRACRIAGMPGRLLHDFRRTAVRNLIRAGVQQAIAMKITGHKTDSIFRRYLIVDEELLAQATGAVADLLGDPERFGPRSRHARGVWMRLRPIRTPAEMGTTFEPSPFETIDLTNCGPSNEGVEPSGVKGPSAWFEHG